MSADNWFLMLLYLLQSTFVKDHPGGADTNSSEIALLLNTDELTVSITIAIPSETEPNCEAVGTIDKSKYLDLDVPFAIAVADDSTMLLSVESDTLDESAVLLHVIVKVESP